VQRRHQKVIEESPSPFMTPELRAAMGEAAVRLARATGYVNAGTAEFLVDAQRNFYFLEVNTRLQVEHPVTECVTGLDLVKWQLRIAAGEPLPLAQKDVVLRGHAIECRIYAEDPASSFFPSPGKLSSWRAPAGPGIRLDDGVYEGWTVPGDYDPLLAKLIATGADRKEAAARLRRALDEFDVRGIKTNTNLFRDILADPEFLSAAIHTRWLDQRLPSLLKAGAAWLPDAALSLADIAVIAAVLWQLSRKAVMAGAAAAGPAPVSRWKLEGRREQLARDPER
jgi:acetyl-CoA carboxylase biotin carboxylase subunit